MPLRNINRRSFLRASSGTIAAASFLANTFGGELPPVKNPRATDGDAAYEPNWDKRLTITVGPEKADLVGADDKVLQAAVDYATRFGGGTVHVLPGTYTLRNAVFLPSRIRLLGSGADSILTKIPSQKATLADDSDWYDQEITLTGAKDFRVGDGVALQGKDPNHGGPIVIKRTLVARSGNRFKLNDGLRKSLWVSVQPTCASLFPLLTSENTADVTIENITLDGNRENSEHFDGNHAGCIFLQDCNRYTIRNVEARNYNGDGISFQICHDVVIENCHSHDNADLGVHPGSGAQRPLIRNNRIERNGVGIYWCWGVKYGLAEGNRIDANRDGITIGHNDTDNIMRNNIITNSTRVGVLFRQDARGRDFWANRNRLENNRIVNSGGENGVAVDIQGQTKQTVIVGNEIRETREPANRIGIRIAEEAGDVQLAKNTIEGFASAVRDLRSA